MRLTLERLRNDAIRRTLFPQTTLKAAIRRMGFVQADPIRSPARAQDLILRHRVKNYHAGDLERRYSALDIEEDFFYTYGFLPRENWQNLHPREMGALSDLEQRVLDVVARKKGTQPMHPKDLEKELGRDRVTNYWGGFSKATTRALHALHHRGLLRITGRDNGIRLYEAAPPIQNPLAPEARFKRLVLLVARILAPMPEASLLEVFWNLRYYAVKGPEVRKAVVPELIKSGELEAGIVDGIRYLWPAGKIVSTTPPPVVRILAPFDPLVWDRRRFAHFWGWSYRFEAYTPPKKRVRGYYAMPLLWGADVVGWANISRQPAGAHGKEPHAEIGFARAPIKDRAFQRALDEELDRMRVFLEPPLS